MSFNLKKYLVENNLTIISRIREEEEDLDIEPTKADLKQTEKDFRDLDKDKEELEDLKSKVRVLINTYGKIEADGKLNIRDKEAYNNALGDMPSKIQKLKAKIKKI